MFCRNCGNELENDAVVCTKCGFGKGTGDSFCPNCGKPVNKGAMACTECGASLQSQSKSKIAAGLLGIFLGVFGVHNFYLGYTGKAVAQLLISVLTCGFGAIISEVWGIVEGIMILTGDIKADANGVPLSD